MARVDLPPSVQRVFAALDARIAALERAAGFQVGAGAPTHAARDGTPYLDKTNNRLYVRTNGAWKSAALT